MSTGFRGKYKNELKLLCQWCETRFTSDNFRLFCEPKCKSEYYVTIKRHLWTEEEEAYILKLIGHYPLARIVDRVSRKFKLPVTCVKSKVESYAQAARLQISERTDNFSVAEWAKRLGKIGELRIHRWLKKGLKSRRYGKDHLISIADMRRFARDYPSDLHSISEEKLKELFPKATWAKYVEAILTAKPLKAPIRPVMCVETGVEYKSLTLAETGTGFSRAKIKNSIAHGIPATNEGKYLTFRYVD
jgi:hypothetical protein